MGIRFIKIKYDRPNKVLVIGKEFDIKIHKALKQLRIGDTVIFIYIKKKGGKHEKTNSESKNI